MPKYNHSKAQMKCQLQDAGWPEGDQCFSGRCLSLWSKSSGLVEFSLISSNCDKTHQVISASLICLMQSTRLSFHQMYCVLSPHTYSCSQKLSYWHTQQVGELMAGYRISGEWKVTAVLSSWNLWKGEVWIVFWILWSLNFGFGFSFSL